MDKIDQKYTIKDKKDNLKVRFEIPVLNKYNKDKLTNKSKTNPKEEKINNFNGIIDQISN
jgi:hypothetical protein